MRGLNNRFYILDWLLVECFSLKLEERAVQLEYNLFQLEKCSALPFFLFGLKCSYSL